MAEALLQDAVVIVAEAAVTFNACEQTRKDPQ